MRVTTMTTMAALALCAGLTVSAQTPESPAEERVDPREGGLEVGLGEWAITLEADAVRPGEITFVVHNGGARAHGFRVRSDRRERERGRERRHGRGRGRGGDRFEARTRLIEPGGDAELTVVLESGVYEVDCFVEEADVGEHDALGMEAVLTVRADAPLVPPPPAPTSAVAIERFAFSPAVLTVKAGTTVTWTNRDPEEHTVTAADGSFDSAVLAPGASFRRTFDAPGSFAYECRLHPMVQGRVEVTEQTE